LTAPVTATPMAALLVLAGLGLARAARKRGEVGCVATTVLWWNTLLLIVYGVGVVAMFVAVIVNPITPS